MVRNLAMFILLLIVVAISGCSHFLTSDDSPPFYVELSPVPKGLLGQSSLEKFNFDGVVKQSMLVQSELSVSGINLVAMSFEGIPIVQAKWLAKTDIIETDGVVLARLNPRQIIHDLQSVKWPLTSLNASAKPDYRVEELLNERNIKTRKFYFKNSLVRSIEYRQNMVIFNDFRHDYQLEIIRLDNTAP